MKDRRDYFNINIKDFIMTNSEELRNKLWVGYLLYTLR